MARILALGSDVRSRAQPESLAWRVRQPRQSKSHRLRPVSFLGSGGSCGGHRHVPGRLHFPSRSSASPHSIGEPQIGHFTGGSACCMGAPLRPAHLHLGSEAVKISQTRRKLTRGICLPWPLLFPRRSPFVTWSVALLVVVIAGCGPATGFTVQKACYCVLPDGGVAGLPDGGVAGAWSARTIDCSATEEEARKKCPPDFVPDSWPSVTCRCDVLGAGAICG